MTYGYFINLRKMRWYVIILVSFETLRPIEVRDYRGLLGEWLWRQVCLSTSFLRFPRKSFRRDLFVTHSVKIKYPVKYPYN